MAGKGVQEEQTSGALHTRATLKYRIDASCVCSPYGTVRGEGARGVKSDLSVPSDRLLCCGESESEVRDHALDNAQATLVRQAMGGSNVCSGLLHHLSLPVTWSSTRRLPFLSHR